MLARSSCLAVVALLVLCLLPAVSGGSPKHARTIDEVLSQGAGAAGSATGRSGQDKLPDAYDILLTTEQYERLYKEGTARSGGRTVADPWTKAVIPYYIKEADFPEGKYQQRMIKEAMEIWQNLTCVHFRERTSRDANSVIIHTGRGDGCTADLGMRGGEQTVNLATNCFDTGTLVHELGHTLGMIHEQQRQTRDGYIRVDYYAVETEQVGWLAKYAKGSDDKMGLPYDYRSIMHYGRTAFSKDGVSQTIYTRDPSQEYLIGGGDGPSFLDAKLINLMYNCHGGCPRLPSCGKDCFVTKDCTCFCKKDMPEDKCEDKDEHCGYWAGADECDNNPGYMLTNCRQSCGACDKKCTDDHDQCDFWAQSGECRTAKDYMHRVCRKSCGICSIEPCKDNRRDCRSLADDGQCKRNLALMLTECKKTCEFCEQDLGQDPTDKPGCVDYDMGCQYLADQGMCQTLKQSMSVMCAEHCGTCHVEINIPDTCKDKSIHCVPYMFSQHCEKDAGIRHTCPESCGICPELGSGNCRDKKDSCPSWAHYGECHKLYVQQNCRYSCKLC